MVDKENITDLLIQFKDIGLGGVEIEPIYGIQGKDAQEIAYLSPKWVAMLEHTIKIANSLGLGVDLSLGTGWPYGGPQVEVPYAATRLITDAYFINSCTVTRPRIKYAIATNFRYLEKQLGLLF